MRYFVPLLVTLIFQLSTYLVYSESLTVSLQVGVTEVVFSGYTSPNAQIVVKEDGSVVGTTTSDSGGNWSKTISVALPALHTYELYGTDSNSRTTTTISYSLNVSGNTTTTIDNIVIPPTIELSGTSLIGSSYPSSTITLTFSGGGSANFSVPPSGNWTYDLSAVGSNTITATAMVGSYLSVGSEAVVYTAPTPTPSTTPTTASTPSPSASAQTTSSPSPTPSVSPSPTPPPFFISLYDQNHDGKLGLGELFEVITSWLKKHLPCDLNRDQKCNLIDLSILLYYFER